MPRSRPGSAMAVHRALATVQLVVIATCFFGLVAAQSAPVPDPGGRAHSAANPPLYEAGHELVFQYEYLLRQSDDSQADAHGLGAQARNIGFRCQLHVLPLMFDSEEREWTVQVAAAKIQPLELTDTTNGDHIAAFPDVVNHSPELVSPFTVFQSESGSILGVRLDEDEPLEVSNLKRGLATALQVTSAEDGAPTFEVRETDASGSYNARCWMLPAAAEGEHVECEATHADYSSWADPDVASGHAPMAAFTSSRRTQRSRLLSKSASSTGTGHAPLQYSRHSTALEALPQASEGLDPANEVAARHVRRHNMKRGSSSRRSRKDTQMVAQPRAHAVAELSLLEGAPPMWSVEEASAARGRLLHASSGEALPRHSVVAQVLKPHHAWVHGEWTDTGREARLLQARVRSDARAKRNDQVADDAVSELLELLSCIEPQSNNETSSDTSKCVSQLQQAFRDDTSGCSRGVCGGEVLAEAAEALLLRHARPRSLDSGAKREALLSALGGSGGSVAQGVLAALLAVDCDSCGDGCEGSTLQCHADVASVAFAAYQVRFPTPELVAALIRKYEAHDDVQMSTILFLSAAGAAGRLAEAAESVGAERPVIVDEAVAAVSDELAAARIADEPSRLAREAAESASASWWETIHWDRRVQWLSLAAGVAGRALEREWLGASDLRRTAWEGKARMMLCAAVLPPDDIAATRERHASSSVEERRRLSRFGVDGLSAVAHLRSALFAAANLRSAVSPEAVVPLLSHREYEVRTAAIAALASSGPTAAADEALSGVFAADETVDEWDPTAPPLGLRLAVIAAASEWAHMGPGAVLNALTQQLQVLGELHVEPADTAWREHVGSFPTGSPGFGASVVEGKAAAGREGTATAEVAAGHARRDALAPCVAQCLIRSCPADIAVAEPRVGVGHVLHACREDCFASCSAAIQLEAAILKFLGSDVVASTTSAQHKSLRDAALAAHSRRRKLLSATLIDMQIGNSKQWHKVFGGEDMGAYADIDLTNLVQLRIGLFGGLMDININDEAKVVAYAWSWDFDIAHARVAFRAGFSYMSIVPEDLLRAVTFIADNVAAGLEAIGSAYASALLPFGVSLKDLFRVFREYVVPIVDAMDSREEFISTVFSVVDLGDVVNKFVPKLVAAAQQQAQTNKLLNVTLRVIDQVATAIGEGDGDGPGDSAVALQLSDEASSQLMPKVRWLEGLARNATSRARTVVNFAEVLVANVSTIAQTARGAALRVREALDGTISALDNGQWFSGVVDEAQTTVLHIRELRAHRPLPPLLVDAVDSTGAGFAGAGAFDARSAARGFAIISDAHARVQSLIDRVLNLIEYEPQYSADFAAPMSAMDVDIEFVEITAAAADVARTLPRVLAVAGSIAPTLSQLDALRRRVSLIPFSVLAKLSDSRFADSLDSVLAAASDALISARDRIVPVLSSVEPHVQLGVRAARQLTDTLDNIADAGYIADQLAEFTQDKLLGGLQQLQRNVSFIGRIQDTANSVMELADDQLARVNQTILRGIGSASDVLRNLDGNVTQWLQRKLGDGAARLATIVGKVDEQVERITGYAGKAQELVDLFAQLSGLLGDGKFATTLQRAADRAIEFMDDAVVAVDRVQSIVEMVDAALNADSETTIFAEYIDRLEEFAVSGFQDVLARVEGILDALRDKVIAITDISTYAERLLDRAFNIAGTWLADTFRPYAARASALAEKVDGFIDSFEGVYQFFTEDGVDALLAKILSGAADFRAFIRGFAAFHNASQAVFPVLSDARSLSSAVQDALPTARSFADDLPGLVTRYIDSPCGGSAAASDCFRAAFFERLSIEAQRLSGLSVALSAVVTVDQGLPALHDSIDFFTATQRLFGRFIAKAEEWLGGMLGRAVGQLGLAEKLSAAEAFASEVEEVIGRIGGFVDTVGDGIDTFEDKVYAITGAFDSVTGKIDISGQLLQELGINLGPLSGFADKLGQLVEFAGQLADGTAPLSGLSDMAAAFATRFAYTGVVGQVFDWMEKHAPIAQAVVDVIEAVDGTVLQVITKAAEVATGVSVDLSTLSPPSETPACDDTFCLHSEPRSGSVYRNGLFPARYTFFWDHTSPALIGQGNTRFRWVVPGLFEDYSPGGVTWIESGGDKLPLLSLRPTGPKAPRSPTNGTHSSVFAVLAANGNVKKFYRLKQRNGLPYAGRVGGVAVVWEEMVYTCDDSLISAAENSGLPGRNGEIVGFKYSDLAGALNTAGVADLTIAAGSGANGEARWSVDAKASVLFFQNDMELGTYLWVGETYSAGGDGQPTLNVPDHHAAPDIDWEFADGGEPPAEKGWVAAYALNGVGVPLNAGSFGSTYDVDGVEVLAPAQVMYVGANVVGVAFFNQLGYDYVAVARGSYLTGFECSVEFWDIPAVVAGAGRTPGSNVPASAVPIEPKTSIRTPGGLEGLGYDGINYLVAVFSSATNERLVDVERTQSDIEDSLFRLRTPVLQTIKPGIFENTIFLKFLGSYVYGPECLLPIGEECKDEEDRRRVRVLSARDSHAALEEVGRRPWSSLGLHSIHDQAQVSGLSQRRALQDGSSSCLEGGKVIFEKDVEFFSIEQYFVVVVVPLVLRAGAGGHFDVSYRLGLCIEDRKLTGALIPRASINVFAEIAVSIVIAEAGIRVKAIVLETSFIPEASLVLENGVRLAVCLDIDIVINPLTIKISAFYSVLACVRFKKVCAKVFGAKVCVPVPVLFMCDPGEWDIWTWALDPITKSVLSICWSAPDRTPPVGAPVGALQADLSTVNAKWEEFEDPDSGVTHYEVCIGGSPGSGNILACHNVMKALSITATDLALPDGRDVVVSVYGYNGDGARTGSFSTPFVADTSAPVIHDLRVLDGRGRWTPATVGAAGAPERLLTHVPTPGFDIRCAVVEPQPPSIERAKVAIGTVAVPPGLVDPADAPAAVASLVDWQVLGSVDALTSKDTTPRILRVQTTPRDPDSELTHDTEYFLSFFTLNSMGNAAVTSSIPVYFDATPPTIADAPDGYVTHGPDGNITKYYQYGDVYESYWAGISDPETDILHYEFKYVEVETGRDMMPWRNVGLSTSIRLELQKMQHGFSYRTLIRAWNYAGNTAVFESSAVIVDKTLPVCPVAVTDVDPSGTTDDWEATDNLTSITASFGCGDPESGIVMYSVGIGTYPGGTDVLDYGPIEGFVADESKEIVIAEVTSPSFMAVHATTYFFNLMAEDGAGWLDVKFSSGVLYDETPPFFTTLRIRDGDDKRTDRAYSGRSNALSATWQWAFADVESDVASYRVGVASSSATAIPDVAALRSVGSAMEATVGGLSLAHGEEYYVVIEAANRVGNTVTALTSGVVIDLTPPVVSSLRDGNALQHGDVAGVDREFQSEVDIAFAEWNATDPESGIERVFVMLREALPPQRVVVDWLDVGEGSVYGLALNASQGPLRHNTRYLIVIRALNGAGAASEKMTNGVLIDTTAPDIWSISDLNAEEDVDIVGDSDTPFAAFWTAGDVESGLREVSVAVGSYIGGEDVRAFMPLELSAAQQVPGPKVSGDISVRATSETPVWINGMRLYTTLKALNGAGQWIVGSSDGVLCDFQGPDAGSVVDGWGDADATYSSSTSQLTAQLRGFVDHESEISECFVGVGTAASLDDVAPMSQRNVTSSGKTFVDGLSLIDGAQYYVTVACADAVGHRSSAVSSSGVIIDATAPEGGTVSDTGGEPSYDDVDVQASRDALWVAWSGFADEHSGIRSCMVGAGTRPRDTDLSGGFRSVGAAEATMLTGLTLADGTWAFATVVCFNNAGLGTYVASDGVLVDASAPECSFERDSNFMHAVDRLLVRWSCEDLHSGVATVNWAVGSYPGGDDVAPFQRAMSPKSSPTDEGLSFSLLDGVVYYVSCRAVNTAGVAATWVAPPVSIDRTPPVAEFVRVGVHGEDLAHWGSSSFIDLHWRFIDLESVITEFDVALCGSATCSDGADPLAAATFSGEVMQARLPLPASGVLSHVTDGDGLFARVTATNAADRSTVLSSHEVTFDSSPPTCSLVWDGSGASDVQFQAQRGLASVQWACEDPQSGLVGFEVAFRDENHADAPFGDRLPVETTLYVAARELSIGLQSWAALRAINHAGGSVVVRTDGLVVDVTSATFSSVSAPLGTLPDLSSLVVSWAVADDESGIAGCSVGLRSALGVTVLPWVSVGASARVFHYAGRRLDLQEATSYVCQVRCTNGAGLVSEALTLGTTVDSTAPTAGSATVALIYPTGYDEQASFPDTVSGVTVVVSWSGAVDTETGIQRVAVGVGDGEGAGAVAFTGLSGGWVVASADDMLQHELRVSDVTVQSGGSVVATVRVFNGVGQSTDFSAPPLRNIVLASIVAGEVVDGPESDGVDRDAQRTSFGVWAWWSAFHDPVAPDEPLIYEASLGTAAGLSDVVDWVQLPEGELSWSRVSGLSLSTNTKYFTNVRATTVNGASKTASSDGFIVDAEPPSVSHVGVGASDGDELSEVLVITTGTLSVSWHVSDGGGSGVSATSVSVGTNPTEDDVVEWVAVAPCEGQCTWEAPGIDLLESSWQGTTLYASIRVTDAVGHESTVRSAVGAVVDTSAPIAGSVYDGDTVGGAADMDFTGTTDHLVHAVWEGFADPESTLTEYWWCVGRTPYACDLLHWASAGMNTTVTELPAEVGKLSVVSQLAAMDGDGAVYYVTVRAVNGAGLFVEAATDGVRVDFTPPTAGEVWLGRPEQPVSSGIWTASDGVTVSWNGFDSPSPGVSLSHFEVCVSSTPVVSSSADVNCDGTLASSVPSEQNSVSLVGGVALPDGVWHAVVVARDLAGHVAAASSSAWTVDTAAPSPPPVVIETLTSTSADDIDFLTDGEAVHVQWRSASDGAVGTGVVAYEWLLCGLTTCTSPARVSGTTLRTTINGPSLVVGRRYYFAVAAIDAAGFRSQQTTSDGFIFDDTAPTRFAVEEDREFIASFSPGEVALGVHWSAAVDPETVDVTYEWCLGTSVTSCDVFPWTAVGDALFATTEDFTAPPAGTRVVHGRVKACNPLGLCTESYSAGVSLDEVDPVAGTAMIGHGFEQYVVNAKEVVVSWTGFGDAGSGLASFAWSLLEVTPDGQQRVAASGVAQSSESFALATSLALSSGSDCYAEVTATDGVGREATATSGRVGIDTSPPAPIDGGTAIVIVNASTGSPLADGPEADAAEDEPLYLGSLTTIAARWDAIADPESGIKEFSWTVCHATEWRCLRDYVSVGALPFASDATLQLLRGEPYRAHIRATNLAGLVSEYQSRAIVVDATPPRPGRVVQPPAHSSWDDLQVSWDGFTDEESGISQCEACLGRASAACDVVDWGDVGVGASASLAISDASSILQLTSVRLFASVRCYNGVGAFSVATSSGAVVDESPPDVSAMRVVLQAGSQYVTESEAAAAAQATPPGVHSFATIGGTQLSLYWDAAVDMESGVCWYEHCIGHSPGTDDVRRWERQQCAEDCTLPHLQVALPSGFEGELYASVVARSCSSLASASVSSAALVVDASPPEASAAVVSVAKPATVVNGVHHLSQGAFSVEWGGFKENSTKSTPLTYEVRVMKYPGGIVVRDWLNVGTASRMAHPTGGVLQPALAVVVQVRATNQAGLVSDVVSSLPIVYEGEAAARGEPLDTRGVVGVAGEDIDFVADFTSVSAEWHHAFRSGNEHDGGEEVARATFVEFDVCLATSDVHCDVMGWHNVGAARAATFKAGLDFDPTRISGFVRIVVRGHTLAGQVAVSSSDGVFVDDTPAHLVAVSLVGGDVAGDTVPERWFQTTSGLLRVDIQADDVESDVKLVELALVSGIRDAESVDEDSYDPVAQSGGPIAVSKVAPQLAPGTVNTVSVRCWNGAGVSTTFVAHIFVDDTPPVAGTVADIGHRGSADVDYLGGDVVRATWSGFVDTEATTLDYRWAVVRDVISTDIHTGVSKEVSANLTASAGESRCLSHGVYEGTGDCAASMMYVVPFTAVGNSTYATAESVPLIHGHRYFVVVRACNPHGLCAESTSDGFAVDNAAPVVSDIRDIDMAELERSTGSMALPTVFGSAAELSQSEYSASDAVYGATWSAELLAADGISKVSYFEWRVRRTGEDAQHSNQTALQGTAQQSLDALVIPNALDELEATTPRHSHTVLDFLPVALPDKDTVDAVVNTGMSLVDAATELNSASYRVYSQDSPCCGAKYDEFEPVTLTFDGAIELPFPQPAVAMLASYAADEIAVVMTSNTSTVYVVRHGLRSVAAKTLHLGLEWDRMAAAGSSVAVRRRASGRLSVATTDGTAWQIDLPQAENFGESLAVAENTVLASLWDPNEGNHRVAVFVHGRQTAELTVAEVSGAVEQPPALAVVGDWLLAAASRCTDTVQSSSCVMFSSRTIEGFQGTPWQGTVALTTDGGAPVEISTSTSFAAVRREQSVELLSISTNDGPSVECQVAGDTAGAIPVSTSIDSASARLAIAAVAYDTGAVTLVTVDLDGSRPLWSPQSRCVTVARLMADVSPTFVVLNGGQLFVASSNGISHVAYCHPGWVRRQRPRSYRGLAFACERCPAEQHARGGSALGCSECMTGTCVSGSNQTFGAVRSVAVDAAAAGRRRLDDGDGEVDQSIAAPSHLISGYSYAIDIRAVNEAGNTATASSPGLTVDTTPPLHGSVFDGAVVASALPGNFSAKNTETPQSATGGCWGVSCGHDMNFTASLTSLSANWGGFEDVESGVVSYQACFGTAPGECDVVPLTDVGLSTQFLVTGLELEHAAAYFATVVADNAAHLSSAVSSNGVVVDITPPSLSYVSDGLGGADVDAQSFTDLLFAHWLGSDSESDSEMMYEFSFGSSPGAADIVPVSSTPSELYGVLGLTQLRGGATYYASVRAINGATLASPWMHSNGVRVGKSDAVVEPEEEMSMSFDTVSLSDALQANGSSSTDVARPSTTVGAVTFPPGAVGEATRISTGRVVSADTENATDLVAPEQTAPPADNFEFNGYSFTISAVSPNGTQIEGFKFEKPVRISLYYNVEARLEHEDAADDDFQERQLAPALMFWDTAEGAWIDARHTCETPWWRIDYEEKIYEVDVCHLTQFALFYQDAPVPLAFPVAAIVHLAEPDPAAVAATDLHVRDPARFAFSSGASLVVDGSSSHDPDGWVASATWTYLSGGAFTSGTQITAGASVSGTPVAFPFADVSGAPAVTAVGRAVGSSSSAGELVLDGLPAGHHAVQLTVLDNDEADASTVVSITVNVPPTAVAPESFTIPAESATANVTLNGTASVDLDGVIVGWRWRIVDWPGAAVSNVAAFVADTCLEAAGVEDGSDGAHAALPQCVEFYDAAGGAANASYGRFLRPVVEARGLRFRGEYQFELTCVDNLGATGSTMVTVTTLGGEEVGDETVSASEACLGGICLGDITSEDPVVVGSVAGGALLFCCALVLVVRACRKHRRSSHKRLRDDPLKRSSLIWQGNLMYHRKLPEPAPATGSDSGDSETAKAPRKRSWIRKSFSKQRAPRTSRLRPRPSLAAQAGGAPAGIELGSIEESAATPEGGANAPTPTPGRRGAPGPAPAARAGAARGSPGSSHAARGGGARGGARGGTRGGARGRLHGGGRHRPDQQAPPPPQAASRRKSRISFGAFGGGGGPVDAHSNPLRRPSAVRRAAPRTSTGVPGMRPTRVTRSNQPRLAPVPEPPSRGNEAQ